ncbi:hypothetical protein Tco_0596082 [Tanacetum coccineum]
MTSLRGRLLVSNIESTMEVSVIQHGSFDVMMILVPTEDPFNLYDILNKRKDSGDDLKYPPGFTPSVINVEEVNKKVKWATSNEVNEHVHSTSDKLEESVLKGKLSSNSVCSKRVHTMVQYCANAFNSFISLASLIDLPLDGYVYTCAYKTDNEMKLSIDYGPTPFRFFHSWFNLDGFDKMVEYTWRSLATADSNGMINLKKKLQALKIVIKQWTKNAKKISYKAKISIQSKLSDIDKILDQGGTIRWTLVDGEWIVDPLAVKSVFLKYFSTQFFSPVSPRICFADQFTNRLSLEQQADLERNISNEEIKSSVWDCGTNKSLGPDGFTFEFFRRY